MIEVKTSLYSPISGPPMRKNNYYMNAKKDVRKRSHEMRICQRNSSQRMWCNAN
ncbi:hypothetical protein BJX76DRAFT_265418 [Aspergillus varians]